MAESDRGILVINPLKYTLAHYEGELLGLLGQADFGAVEVAETVPVDGVTGSLERALVAVRCVWQRLRMARHVSGRIVVVVWPLFGYLEPFTLLRLARGNYVYIIVHDPSPLQRAYGQSAWAATLFKAMTKRRNMQVVYHTELAQRVGARDTGVEGTVVPHPVGIATSGLDESRDRHVDARPVVRVLGRFKDTRSLSALGAISQGAAGTCTLEIHGRGWPDVAGWTLNDTFVPESEFAGLVESADCVVIPYDYFFQSGVAVRCLEAGIPIVAPRHEHIAELYGTHWPGAVDDELDWYAAVLRALAVDTECIRDRHRHVVETVRRAWIDLLTSAPASL